MKQNSVSNKQEWGMVVNTFNSSTYEAETDRSFEFKTSLICIYITSSRTSKAERDRQRDTERGREGGVLTRLEKSS